MVFRKRILCVLMTKAHTTDILPFNFLGLEWQEGKKNLRMIMFLYFIRQGDFSNPNRVSEIKYIFMFFCEVWRNSVLICESRIWKLKHLEMKIQSISTSNILMQQTTHFSDCVAMYQCLQDEVANMYRCVTHVVQTSFHSNTRKWHFSHMIHIGISTFSKSTVFHG